MLDPKLQKSILSLKDIKDIREYLRDIGKGKYNFQLQKQRDKTKSSYPNLNVNLNILRFMAKYQNLDDLSYDDDLYYDEILLKGFDLAYRSTPIATKWEEIDTYLDKADCWALVDSFASSFKLTKEELEPTLVKIEEYLNSDNEFYKRFGIDMLLSHYISLNNDYKKKPAIHLLELPHFKDPKVGANHPFIPVVLKLIDKEHKEDEGQIGVAKIGAAMFLIAPNIIYEYLKNDHLDNKTHDDLIDRILRIKNMSKAIKYEIKKLKRYDS